jgi:uroporphyrinogen decarboxylase
LRAGGDVIGVDWRTPLDAAWARLGPGLAVQGNLDPVALLAPWEALERAPQQVLDAGALGRPGHIFNLGHGILPGNAGRQRAAAGRFFICTRNSIEKPSFLRG